MIGYDNIDILDLSSCPHLAVSEDTVAPCEVARLEAGHCLLVKIGGGGEAV